jgi:homoserine kinase
LVIGENLADAGLATGELDWAKGVGGENWRSIHTPERVPGASATPMG